MRRLLVTLALSALGVANAATVNVYTSLAAWQGAITGSAQVQGFDSYAAGDDLTGTQVLPGLTLSSNIGGNMQVFGANQVAAAFGNGRLAGNAQYDGTYALPFLAAALDITSFEANPGVPTSAQDNGLMQFFFSDGSVQDIVVAGNPTGAAIFLGVVSDHAITGFRWHEAHEASGGNEETGLDNFRVAMRTDANQVPLPGTLPLALLALGALPVAVRRRR